MSHPAATLARPTEDLGVFVEGLKEEWRAGHAPPDAAGACRDYPGLAQFRSLVIDLAYEDYCLQEEAGAAPDVEAFCRALPVFRSQVREVLRGHRMVAENPDLFAGVEVAWPKAGDRVEGLDLVRQIGHGAFARVYLATDPEAGHRQVVLKLAPAPSGEAGTLGPIRHPHIGGIHWARRTADGLYALCLPFVGTATLADLIGAAVGPGRPPATAQTILNVTGPVMAGPAVVDPRWTYARGVAAVGARLADALAHLHRTGVAHGDLKPSNVLLGAGGHPYLIDFNLSGGAEVSPLRCGGTFPYMAPERVRLVLGDRPAGDPMQADVYSFGAMLFEALTGRVPVEPIESSDLKAVAADLASRVPPPLRALTPTVPSALAGLVDRCLAADPARRPTATELARGLAEAGRRGRAVPLAIGVLLLAAGLGAAGGLPGPRAVPAAIAAPKSDFDLGREHLAADNPNLAASFFHDDFRKRGEHRSQALCAHCYALTGRHAEAADLYQLALAPVAGFDAPWAWNNLAYSLLHLPKIADHLRPAEAAAGAAIRAGGGTPEAYYNRARARFWLELDPDTSRLKTLSCRADLALALPNGATTADQLFTTALVRSAAGEVAEGQGEEILGQLQAAVRRGYPASAVRKSPVFKTHLGNSPGFAAFAPGPAGPISLPAAFGLLAPPE